MKIIKHLVILISTPFCIIFLAFLFTIGSLTLDQGVSINNIWNENIHIKLKNGQIQKNSSFVIIESPAPREDRYKIIADDLEGKTSWSKGLWEISSPMTKFKHSVIGMSVS